MAHAQLAASYANLGSDQLASESAARAYALRGAVSERESLYITQHYQRLVDGDIEGAIDTLQMWKRLFPRDYVPWNNLASLSLLIGRHRQGLADGQAVAAAEPRQRVGARQSVQRADRARPVAGRPCRDRRGRAAGQGVARV